MSIDSIPDVDIDADGRFKYILIKVFEPKVGVEKLIVRGYGKKPAFIKKNQMDVSKFPNSSLWISRGHFWRGGTWNQECRFQI